VAEPAPNPPSVPLDPDETRFRLRMAEEALSHRGSTKTRMEEAQRVLRRVKSADLPPGEARDRYIWLESALARYQAGEPVSATAVKWLRDQVADVRKALPAA
jgi:hypothetical protein